MCAALRSALVVSCRFLSCLHDFICFRGREICKSYFSMSPPTQILKWAPPTMIQTSASSKSLKIAGYYHVCIFINYPCAVCARVMRLCPSVCVCVCGHKNTPVCVLPLETLHKNTLCSFFTEFIVLWRRFLCWQAFLERLIHGFLKLRVLVRALYGIVGVSPNLLCRCPHSVSHVPYYFRASWGL